MIDLIKDRQEQIVSACRRLGVCRLDVFGSAARGNFTPGKSDIDFVADFDMQNPAGSFLTRYLTLATELERLLGRPVEIITPRSMRNPYFRDSVNASRDLVYAA